MAAANAIGALIPPNLIGRRELANKLGVSPRTIDGWIYAGVCGLRLPYVQVGDRAFFSAAAWQKWSAEVKRLKAAQYDTPKPRKTSAKAKKVLARFGL